MLLKKLRSRILKTIAAAALIGLVVIPAVQVTAAPVSFPLPSDKQLGAKSAVLMYLGETADKDVVLFERDADTKRSPAAMVRLMVGMTAMKLIKQRGIDIDTATGTYTRECNNIISGTGLGIVNMKIGETWKLRDLLSMSMIHTAADACVTLAVELGGSHRGFVTEMNKVAEEIGCKNTSFDNVTGLDNLAQYTTAREMALIMRSAMDDPVLQTMMKNAKYTATAASGAERTYLSTNDMLRKGTSHTYSYMQFGKTGVSKMGGYCLTSVAQNGGYQYMCIVMGSPQTSAAGKSGGHFIDSRTLFDWAFKSFTLRSILGKNEPMGSLAVDLAWGQDSVMLTPEKGVSAVVPNDLDNSSIEKKITIDPKKVNAPVTKGEVYGKVELYIGIDRKIGEDNLVAAESLSRSEVLAIWGTVKGVLTSPWFFAALGLVAVLIVAYVIMSIVHNRKKRRNSRR